MMTLFNEINCRKLHGETNVFEGVLKLGAVVGLSCYTTNDSRAHALLKGTGDRWPETYVAHGSGDDFILPAWGSATYEALSAAGVDASFRHFSGAHEMTAPEIADVLAFLRRRLLDETCA